MYSDYKSLYLQIDMQGKNINTEHHAECAIPRVKQSGGSIIMCESFSYVATGNLVRVHEKVDLPKYNVKKTFTLEKCLGSMHICT